MKAYLYSPLQIAGLALDPVLPEPAAGTHVFAPLSAPAIYDDRIDLSRNARAAPLRAYPYKRFDQSVN